MFMAKPGLRRFRNQAVLPLIISLILVITGYLIFSDIEKYYYRRVEAEAQRFAQSYANSLKTAIEASGIVNKLLTEKLMAAGEVAANLEENQSNEALARLALALRVDEIYSFDSQGVIQYSSNGRFIGWKATGGHLAYSFLQSGSDSLLEDMRLDSSSGNYYKYGYFKGRSGCMVQIGVLAQTINDFLGSFDTKRMLREMEADPNIASASFLSADLAAGPGTIGGEAGTAYQGQWYRVSLPVYVDSRLAGTLILDYDLADTKTLIWNISFIGLAALLCIYLLMLGISLINYKKNKRLTHFAYHDPLTDLPNKRCLQEALREDTDSISRDRRALLLVNYRNFKQINMLFGYQYGENVIKDLSVRLIALCTGAYRLFHLSSDRFAIYVTGYQGREELSALCLKIMDALKAALSFKTIGGNIGVVEAAYFKSDLEKLLKYAMLAGEHVSARELFGFGFYSSEMEAKLQREDDIEKELLSAAKDQAEGGLYLMYQPILRLATEKVCGLEALARLKSKRLGDVPPAEFIPIAEKSQLIVPLGRKILMDACQFLKRLEAAGHDGIVVSVNISAVQLMRDDFVPDILKIAGQAGVNLRCLGIEITESTFADRVDEVNAKLSALKSHGIHIAIDDFGTGYSSLARERDLDVNCLKIDRSFIVKLSELHPDKAISGDIISMAHRLGHEVVAEGVEDLRQKDYLVQNGCDCVQGYLYSRPLMPEDALALLDAGAGRTAAAPLEIAEPECVKPRQQLSIQM